MACLFSFTFELYHYKRRKEYDNEKDKTQKEITNMKNTTFKRLLVKILAAVTAISCFAAVGCTGKGKDERHRCNGRLNLHGKGYRCTGRGFYAGE